MVCGDGEKGECEVKGVRPVRKESNWSREIGKKRRGYRKGDSYLLSTPSCVLHSQQMLCTGQVLHLLFLSTPHSFLASYCKNNTSKSLKLQFILLICGKFLAIKPGLTHHFILKLFAANQKFNCYLPVILFVDCVEHFSNWSSFTDKIAWCLVLLVWFMVFNATFNNISAIPWQSVLLVENRSNQRKTSICHKSLKTEQPEKTTLSRIRTHNCSGDRH